MLYLYLHNELFCTLNDSQAIITYGYGHYNDTKQVYNIQWKLYVLYNDIPQQLMIPLRSFKADIFAFNKKKYQPFAY